MNVIDAMDLLKDGKEMMLEGWEPSQHLFIAINGKLMLEYKVDGIFDMEEWRPSVEELQSDKWIECYPW